MHDCDCNAGEEPDISKLSKQSPSLSIEKRRPMGRLLNQIGRYAQRPSLPRFGIAYLRLHDQERGWTPSSAGWSPLRLPGRLIARLRLQLARSFDPIPQIGTPFELRAFGKPGRVRMVTFLLRFPVVISVSLGLRYSAQIGKVEKAVPWGRPALDYRPLTLNQRRPFVPLARAALFESLPAVSSRQTSGVHASCCSQVP